MRRLRSLVAQSPAIVISMVALFFAGTGAGYAATLMDGTQIAPHSIPGNRLEPHSVGSEQLQAVKIKWHNLALKNGWVSENSRYFTGNPRYAVSNGVVYLSGSMKQLSSNSNPLFALLPKALRPAHDLYITIYALDDTTGTLWITRSGQMRASDGLGAVTNEQGFSSLAGISYALGS